MPRECVDFAKRDNVLLAHAVIKGQTGATVKTSSATTRLGDTTAHGGCVVLGLPTVMIVG